MVFGGVVGGAAVVGFVVVACVVVAGGVVVGAVLSSVLARVVAVAAQRPRRAEDLEALLGQHRPGPCRITDPNLQSSKRGAQIPEEGV